MESALRSGIVAASKFGTVKEKVDEDEDSDDEQGLDEDDPALDPPDIDHQLEAPPADRFNVLTSLFAKGITVSAMQPFSNACTHALLQDDNVGFVVSFFGFKKLFFIFLK